MKMKKKSIYEISCKNVKVERNCSDVSLTLSLGFHLDCSVSLIEQKRDNATSICVII